MKEISIREKLIFYFVSLGVIVIVIVGSLSYYFARQAMLNRTLDQLTSLRLEKKYRIEQFFLDRDRDIDLICNTAEIKRIIQNRAAKNPITDDSQLLSDHTYLNNYILSLGYYQRMFVAKGDSEIFCLNSDQSEAEGSYNDNPDLKDLIDQLSTESFPSDKTLLKDITKSNPVILTGKPVTDRAGNKIGSVILEIPISAINTIMTDYSEQNGLGKSGEAYLVGNDNLMRSNSRFRENAVLNIQVTTPAVNKAFNGDTGRDIGPDYRNINCLGSYSPLNIDGLNWVIIAEIDEQEAMIPVNAIRNSILLVSIIIAASVFIIAMLVSLRITGPLKRLQKATEQIGSGNYEGELKVTSNDEIGLLTETFNSMTDRLKKQSEEIEQEKTKRVSLLIDGQEMERQRLSRDLHDSLGQSLLAVKMKLEQVRHSCPDKSQQIISETQELLKSTIQEIRNITNNLMPPVLEVFGIEKGLMHLCKETEITTGMEIRFISENLPKEIDSRMSIYLYRIAQEGINNIIKHAGASQASVRISSCGNCISLNISDNGRGFNPATIELAGNGLMNMKVRAQLLKGEFQIVSSIGNGTKINVEIPVES